jgi:hypothetical protein
MYHVWLMRRYFQIPGTRGSTDNLLRPQSGSPLGVGAHDRVDGGNRICDRDALTANEQLPHFPKVPWLNGAALGSTAEQVAQMHAASRIAV